jgi:hypothetical protein
MGDEGSMDAQKRRVGSPLPNSGEIVSAATSPESIDRADTPLRYISRSPVDRYQFIGRDALNGMCNDYQQMNNKLHDMMEALNEAREENALLQNQVGFVFYKKNLQ